MKELKMNQTKSLPIDKEAMFLFLSTAFAQMYYDGVKTKRKDIAKLISKLGKKSRLFKNRLHICLKESQDLFEVAEHNLINQPVKKFGRNVVLDDNNELGVHGLLFSAAIILEHRNLSNRKLNLPYTDAQKIYDNFTEKNDICHNALLVAKEFTELVKKS